MRAIRFFGELRLRRSNAHVDIVHGAIHINNPDTVAPIEDVLFEGPVLLVDTGLTHPGGVPYQVRAHGAGRIQAEVRVLFVFYFVISRIFVCFGYVRLFDGPIVFG